jgi:hypothetical protein
MGDKILRVHLDLGRSNDKLMARTRRGTGGGVAATNRRQVAASGDGHPREGGHFHIGDNNTERPLRASKRGVGVSLMLL